ncbi:RNA exonuclease [Cordyceps militaris CM01]|uniref:RNA exonuclease n=1 Tax=Cordyceps militaris (strain CM01) TaxID=983644 RepID=G3J426_CORMM|nr:RNA exonuclease [Cordyceps militaris CM01]EGX96597.1 RNA exonuclease [Cordyceps militaris CM01]
MTTSPLQEALAAADFGPVPASEENIEALWGLTHSHARLQKAGYVLWQLGQSDLDKKKRCGRCTKVIRKGHEKQKSRAQSVKLAPTMAQQIAAAAGDYPRPPGQASVPAHARSISLQAGAGADVSAMMRDMQLGNSDDKDKDNGPCAAQQFHTTATYRRGELESNWTYFSTPHASSPDHVAAVALDCEMGTAASGESELIRVSAVDFFTRRVLVDSLVWPDARMAHLNTRYSGVSRASMDAARRAGRTLAGRAAARAALWRFVGPDTVVVGHSANSDLTALRWIHHVVVDTLLLEMRLQPREERPQSQGGDAAVGIGQEGGGEEKQPRVVPPPPVQDAPKEDNKQKYPGLSLKALTRERLRREIQISGHGHDSLEDALATRDLLLWHMIHKPEPPVIS